MLVVFSERKTYGNDFGTATIRGAFLVLGIRKKNKPIDLMVIVWALSPFLILDWLELAGRFYSPETSKRFACSVLPFLKIAVIFIPLHLSQFATAQCVGHPEEPTVSIVFFMLKVTLTLVAIAILSLWILVLPIRILPARLRKARTGAIEKIINNIEKQGGVIPAFKNLFPTLLGLALFCLYLYGTLDARPQYFKIDFTAKLREDFSCLILSITSALFTSYIVSLIIYRLNKRKDCQVVDVRNP